VAVFNSWWKIIIQFFVNISLLKTINDDQDYTLCSLDKYQNTKKRFHFHSLQMLLQQIYMQRKALVC